MIKLISSLFAAGLIGVSLSAAAAESMKHDHAMMKDGNTMSTHMKAMDTDGDGMISKDEFMKYHEQMYDGMKKNANGMVELKTMSTMHHSSGKGHTMKKGDGMATGDGVLIRDTAPKVDIGTGQKNPN